MKITASCLVAFALTALLGLVAALPASAQGWGSGDYGTGEARRASSVEQGVVVHARLVSIGVEASTSSRVVGGAVGGAFCARLTGNVGDWAVRGALSVACAAGGERLANRVSAERREALEVIVKLDDGRLISVTQEFGSEALQPGDRVFVIRGGTADRVLKG